MTSKRRGKPSRAAAAAETPADRQPPSLGLILVVAVTAVLPLVARHINTMATGTDFNGIQGLVWFGLVIVGAFCAALMDAVRRGELSLPRTGLVVGVGLLAVGAVAAGLAAQNRYASLVGTTQVVLVVLYFLAVLLVADERHAIRWLLAALVAGAVAAAVVSIQNRVTASPGVLMDYFNQYRLDILAARGIAPGSPEEHLYRIRIASDFIGTFYHPNLMACYMAMGLLVAAGLVMGHVAGSGRETDDFQSAKRSGIARAWGSLVSKFRGNSQTMVSSLLLASLAAILVVPLVMTHSRAAIAAAAAGLYLVLVLGLARSRTAKALLLVIPGLIAVSLLVLVLDSGRGSGSLASLRFRWDYWRGTWEVIRRHPWLGVGPANFGGHYVTHKLATAPEEVSHPHNAFLWAWVEAGLAGLLGLVIFAGSGLREALRRMKPPTERLMTEAEIWKRLVLAALVVALVLVFEVADVGSPGLLDAVSAVMGVLIRMAALAVAFVAVLAMGHASGQALWNISRKWIRCGLVGALAAFWLQALVSLNLPHLPTMAGSTCLMALLVATGQSGRRIRWPLGTRGRRSAVAAVVLTVVVAYAALVAHPLIGSNWAIADVEGLPRTSRAYRDGLARAARLCPCWDVPHILTADSDWLRAQQTATPEPHLRHALSELTASLELNPRNISTLQKMVQVCTRLADEHGATEARSEAVRHQRRVVELYPTRAEFRADFARLLETSGDIDAARGQARTAIELDDLMPDPLRKLPPQTRADCERLARQIPE